ncbi:ARCA-like protein [Purpureocillium lavendulum]|uniref:ARCA-like protein n=1 Tax=Purpureocillium lavendulum TaxID=1247861 RepID=A0AB34FVZ8_9HYPO|nr:ARCA-like protein [Purpureocillium lavendulum]
MEPSSKKRKLAPKVNASSAPNPQPGPYPHETPTQQPSQTQTQHYAAHDAPPVADRHDFESFARHLQDAAMLIQRQTERPPYADVSVLMLSWEEDKSVDDDLAALESVLQNQYNFGTQRWQIPTVPNPSIKLGVQMAAFLEHARPNHLLIIYYAGHGYVGSDNQLYWACNARDDAAKLKWDGVRCLFEDAQSDMLLLLDTCALPDPPTAGSHGVKQAIAAYTPERSFRDDSARSFTANLAEALHKLSSGRPFGAQRLYEEVLATRQQQVAQAPRVPNGSSAAPPPAQLPVFFKLTPGGRQHLALAPLPPRPQGASHGDGDANGRSAQGREDQLIDPDSVADLRFDEARILVCTTFVGDASPDMSFFNQWLQNTPPLGTKIAVEGMFLGPPTMLLISMPHSIWNVVQHDKVCCFLGYISSHNMIHLYEKLVGPAGVRPSAKEVEDGRILLEARELAAGTPARAWRESDGHDHPYHSASRDRSLHDGRPDLAPQGSPSGPSYATGALAPGKPKDEVEDSAEMQEAAEQLKALSHVRHRSDEAAAPGQRPRTSLPEGIPNAGVDGPQPTHEPAPADVDSSAPTDLKLTPTSRAKAARRSVMKPETRCNHCSHAPFKDSSSLRKHIAAAHTRPFPCAFSFAGCTSTFGSKNEWKRHISSQHLCLQFYRCSQCPQSAVEGKGNEFNRKDLFTQHLRRMHAPFQVKRAMSKGETKLLAEWEEHVKSMHQTCLVTRRQPPQKSACPKPGCHYAFDGPGSWDEWTEHVGRHMEKGEAQNLGVDPLLAQWALEEGIIKPKGNGEYRLSASNGLTSGAQGNGSMLDRNDSSLMSLADSSQLDSSQMDASQMDTSMTDARPLDDAGEGQSSVT